jgi:hypothetical protein
MNIVIVGQEETFGALMEALVVRGHAALLLTPQSSAMNALTPNTTVFASFGDLKARSERALRACDLALVGSHLVEGIFIGAWVVANVRGLAAFYDANTPETLALLAQDACPYLSHILVRRYSLYLSSTDGADHEQLSARLRAQAVHWLPSGSPAERAAVIEACALALMPTPRTRTVGASPSLIS